MSSTASVLCLKLHTDSETLRIRVDPEDLQSYDKLCEYVEKAWRELQVRDYRLFYMDEDNEFCLLNNLSLPDAIAGAEAEGKATNSLPVLDIYVDVEGGKEPSFTPLDPVSLMVADLLDDLDYVSSPLSALQLVDSMLAADQDLGKVAQTLKAKKEEQEKQDAVKDQAPAEAEKIASKGEQKSSVASASVEKKATTEEEKPKVEVSVDKSVEKAGSKPEVTHMEKEVSSEKEAKDAMADFLAKSGFVSDKKSGEDLVSRMFQNVSGLQQVANRLMGYEQPESKKDSKEVADETKQLQQVESNPEARDFIDMLSDLGFVENKAAARELVGALQAAQTDLDQLAQRFTAPVQSEKKASPAVTDKEAKQSTQQQKAQ
ncbi:hypothetical protein FOL47_001407 [Perkinsus chesapeaki]|uniref:Uncharacterized protein n=1 Tax=Perkinsus chesapeaki TaxID=330153 RepID=A0A7J6MIY9_PERCH|nr:hypothetical protein FOL47_001407 [Perkinsus chesapeaki]